MEDKPLAVLRQRYGLWKLQELSLYETELKVYTQSGLNSTMRKVPLDVFDLNETEGRVFPDGLRRFMAVSAVVAVAGLATAAAMGLEGSRVPAWTWAVGAAGAALAAVLAGLYVGLSYEAVYFYSAFNGDFLCAVVTSGGDRAATAAFVQRIKEQARRRTEQAKEDAEMPSIARELKALHELRKKKVISDDEFENKKQSLLDELMCE